MEHQVCKYVAPANKLGIVRNKYETIYNLTRQCQVKHWHEQHKRTCHASTVPERTENMLIQKLASEGKYEMLQSFLSTRDFSSVIDQVDSDGQTPLMNAIQCDQYECVRVLVPKSNVNARSVKQDMTPLGILALSPHSHVHMMARLLVEHGASITDLQQHDKYNLLHLACSNGNVSFVQYLLSKQVLDINTHSAHGYTALHYCVLMRPDHVHENFFQCCKLLLQSGVDIKQTTRDGKWNALTIAIKYNRVALLSLLLPLYYPSVATLMSSKQQADIIERLQLYDIGTSPSAQLLKKCTKLMVKDNEPSDESVFEDYNYLEKMNEQVLQWNNTLWPMITSVRSSVLPALVKLYETIQPPLTSTSKIKISHETVLSEIDQFITNIETGTLFYAFYWKLLTEQMTNGDTELESLILSSQQQKKMKKKLIAHKEQLDKKKITNSVMQKKMHKMVIPDPNISFIVEKSNKNKFIMLMEEYWKQPQVHGSENSFTPDIKLLRLFIGLLLLKEC